jgi:nucleotide-binding universal stress UspA family protein
MENDRSSVIVVGVDDSDASVAALVFAMREAVRRRSAVEAVTAWYFNNPFHLEGASELAEKFEDRARDAQDRAITRAREQVQPAPPVSQTVILGEPPAKVLLRAAEGADFLVVGHTQHRPVVLDRLLGSTSRDCLRHATMPVVVVPWLQQQAEEVPEEGVLA